MIDALVYQDDSVDGFASRHSICFEESVSQGLKRVPYLKVSRPTGINLGWYPRVRYTE